ncbi:zinc finger protein 704-like isoform X2 [Amphiura filiformis]|uniref:zinc finger protein 704-like isoform X2 n=1 Tax=Amphiura filiformis TaxID=82378 RepID=UPI003B21DC35
MDAATVIRPTFAMNNCGKRPVKRSFFGTRVCAPWQDGIYYSGVVRTMTSNKLAKCRSELSYIVIFDDGYCKDYLAHQIIGPGFQNISTVHLKFNQKVYITHNGREVCGHVQKHKKQTNEVFIKLNDVSETLVHRKLDEVRLLEKRKCVEHQKITSSSCSEAKRKGTHINKMDVPSAKTPKVEEEPLMDDVMAAMVLTSLSASPLGGYRSRHNSNESTASSTSDILLPTSPRSPPPFGDMSFSPTSSGHFSWDMNSRGTPSPVSSTSDVEYTSGHYGSMIFGPPSVDEGIDMTDPGTLQRSTDSKPIQNNTATVKTLYKCTWPGCGKTLCTVQGIEKHIRTLHLRNDPGQVNDHEEEFYYTEIDTTVDTVSDTFANMYTSPSSPLHTPTHMVNPAGMMTPPPEQIPFSAELRPETLCDRLSPPPLQIVENNNNEQQFAVVTPVLISPQQHQQQASFSWPTVPTTQFTRFQAAPQFTPSSPPHPNMRHKHSLVEQRQHQHQAASPKTNQHFVIPPKAGPAGSPVHAKIRSEGKKCRKVYGMDNRDLWCTQCRWKKACVRFT